jgi:phosphoglucosamine mutase
VSALQVLQCCVRSGRTLAQLLAEVTLFPQVLLNVRCARGALGRVLIRASGTEPVLRVMVEARDAAQASRCAERLAEAVRAA